MSIISISGRMGSGKDEVGKIIQYLTHCKDESISYEEWQNEVHFSSPEWKIKKFAYKLKQISAIILGCNVEDFEDRDFKNKELGPEWEIWYWTHYKFSKDSNVEGRISKIYSSKEEAEQFPIEQVEGANLKSLRLTPRTFLQILGTDAGRDILHPNIWINALFADYTSKSVLYSTPIPPNPLPGEPYGVMFEANFPLWCVTDTRFPNEMQAIKDKGGITIRVDRNPQKITVCRGPNNCEEVPFDRDNRKHMDLLKGELLSMHESETALDTAQFDYIVDNNGSIGDLIEQVKTILEKENII